MEKSESGTDGHRVPKYVCPGYELRISMERLSKEENLKDVWDEKVRSVLNKHHFICQVDWNECWMRVEATNDVADGCVWMKGASVLDVLACGETTKWVEPIMSGHVQCEKIHLNKPADMTEDEFSIAYGEFIQQFHVEYELRDRLSIYPLYEAHHVIVLSSQATATRKVRFLVQSCLNCKYPFDESYKVTEHPLFLDLMEYAVHSDGEEDENPIILDGDENEDKEET